jgi:hypothetical protein
MDSKSKKIVEDDDFIVKMKRTKGYGDVQYAWICIHTGNSAQEINHGFGDSLLYWPTIYAWALKKKKKTFFRIVKMLCVLGALHFPLAQKEADILVIMLYDCACIHHE